MRPAVLLTVAVCLLLAAGCTTQDPWQARARQLTEGAGLADVTVDGRDGGWVQLTGRWDSHDGDAVVGALDEGGWTLVQTSTLPSGATLTLASDGPLGAAVAADGDGVTVRVGDDAVADPPRRVPMADSPGGGGPAEAAVPLPDAPDGAVDVRDVRDGGTSDITLPEGTWTLVAVAGDPVTVTVTLAGLEPFPEADVAAGDRRRWRLAGPDQVTVTASGGPARVWLQSAGQP